MSPAPLAHVTFPLLLSLSYCVYACLYSLHLFTHTLFYLPLSLSPSPLSLSLFLFPSSLSLSLPPFLTLPPPPSLPPSLPPSPSICLFYLTFLNTYTHAHTHTFFISLHAFLIITLLTILSIMGPLLYVTGYTLSCILLMSSSL